MSRALLIGNRPPLNYEFVEKEPYEAVVIGSLTMSQLLRFSEQPVLEALAKGMPVVLYTPGLPEAPKNRGLAAALASGGVKIHRLPLRQSDQYPFLPKTQQL